MQQAQQTKVNTKDLVETALLIALVYIATRFINIRAIATNQAHSTVT